MSASFDTAYRTYRELANASLRTYLKEGDQPRLKAAMKWLPSAGGKRMRPVLVQMVAQAIGGERAAQAALPVGVALETIHNFTLVHDDIMDRSELRRKRPTVHVRWDEATAINAGDGLFARSFEILVDTPVGVEMKVEIVRKVATMVRRIAEGQQMDMEFEDGARPPSEARYVKMIEKKTALMFSTAAYCGARVAGAPLGLAEELEAYGRWVGIAFQIQDDLLDLGALQAKLGKPSGKDIRNGKRTVMAIWSLRRLQGDDLRAFRRVLGNQRASRGEVAKAVRLMEKCGALAHARQLADRHAIVAKASLRVLPPGKGKDHLTEFVDLATTRSS